MSTGENTEARARILSLLGAFFFYGGLLEIRPLEGLWAGGGKSTAGQGLGEPKLSSLPVFCFLDSCMWAHPPQFTAVASLKSWLPKLSPVFSDAPGLCSLGSMSICPTYHSTGPSLKCLFRKVLLDHTMEEVPVGLSSSPLLQIQ